jgi:MFS transporter, UMF1 family
MAEPVDDDTRATREGLLERLGLHRPELRAWAMYDWANSAMITVVIATVYPLFFSALVASAEPHLGEEEAAQLATVRHGIATYIAIVVAAVISPVLGAVADYTAAKKRLLGLFMGIGIAAVACMYLIQHGQWLFAATLFVLANIGATASFVFYDGLLPHVADEKEMDRVSTAGFALGYVGGGTLLAACLVLIMRPAWFGLPAGPGISPDQATLPARLSFVAVAFWWLIFSIPLFLRVREPPKMFEPGERPALNPFRVAFSRLYETFSELRQFRHAFLLLAAFLLYSDGINAIIRMAVIYGGERGIPQAVMIAAILVTQFVGIPFTFAFGLLAGWIGARRAIFMGLCVYMTITVLGFFMTTAAHFIALAVMVGMVQGGTQALSRSLFASMIPKYKSGQFFGFFGVMDKFAGALGVGLMTVVARATGETRYGILGVIVFFIIGALLLRRVNVPEGQRTARAAEAKARVAAAVP